MRKKPRLLIRVLAEACHLAIWLLPLRRASDFMGWLTLRLSSLIVNETAIERNLRMAFRGMDDSQIDAQKRAILEHSGRLIAEVAKMSVFRSGFESTQLRAIGALEYPFHFRERAIFVTGHFGNWELLPIIFPQHGIPITVIHSELGHPAVDRRLMSFRRHTGATYVEKSKSLRACINALKRGESIALLVDQRVDVGISVEFFGHDTIFTHFPARMAMRFGCPIIVVQSVRTGKVSFSVVFHEPIWPKPDLGAQAERDLTQRMAKVIEDCIRQYPDQWFCNKKRWKERLGAEEIAKETAA